MRMKNVCILIVFPGSAKLGTWTLLNFRIYPRFKKTKVIFKKCQNYTLPPTSVKKNMRMNMWRYIDSIARECKIRNMNIAQFLNIPVSKRLKLFSKNVKIILCVLLVWKKYAHEHVTVYWQYCPRVQN